MAERDSSTTDSPTDESARIAALEAALADRDARIADRDARIADLVRERDELRAAYDRLWLELELLRRRIFIAKAERVDTAQLELEFADKLAALDELAGTLGIRREREPAGNCGSGESRRRPTGRRDLRTLELVEERVEILDPELESLVAAGKAERIDFEKSYKLAYARGGLRRLVVARAKYRLPDAVAAAPETTALVTAPLPPEVFPRALAAVSLIARIIVDKYADGLPLHRQEERFARVGVPIDRGTMCRWVEHAGATLGATVVEAMRKDALATAFCIATDATGVLVQPLPDTQTRRACRRGHYFVQIADRDHVFFEYVPKETSAAVGTLFKGFSGYIQADAKSVYDALFNPPPDPVADEDAVPTEVGCMSHARRKLWEATCAKSAVAREGLVRLGRLFALERKWKRLRPAERKALRDHHARPHAEAFFVWAQAEYERVKHQRGLLRSALGYCVRQKQALMRYLDDGRLELTNNGSERELRRIAVGRKAWLFVGSDDHAQAAGHLFSLVASARLHGLDPEMYLRDVLRVLPHWPRERYLELAPKYWPRTRALVDPRQLAADVGPLTVPAAPPEQQQSPAA